MSNVLSTRILTLIVLLFGLQACSQNEQEKAAEKTSEASNVVNVELKPEKTHDAEKPAEEPKAEMAELVPEPKPEISHKVVTQEEIYKNWPYQKESRNLATQEATSKADTMVDKAVDAVQEKAKDVKTAVVDKVAAATNASKEAVTAVVDKVKETAKPAAATGGKEHVVNAKGLTAFDKPIIYIAPGDTVNFRKLNGGHNSESVFVPEGAEPWKGALNKNISVTLTVPGIYGYICFPHAGLGMNGVIVVGDAGDKEVVMEKLRALPQTDFARKLLGKVNKVKADSYVK